MKNTLKNRVLLISFYFPPDNTIAAVRIGKFAKYLPEFGWEPIILTVNHVGGLARTLPVEVDESKIVRTSYYTLFDLLSRRFGKNNPALSTDNAQTNVPKAQTIGSRIIRFIEPFSRLPVIEKITYDPMGWYGPAVEAGMNIIKDNNIKVIFSTYGPSVPHFIGARLQRETGIPWIADYRDDWIDEYRKHPQPLHYFDQQWEKHTVKKCSAIVANTQPLANILEKAHHKHTTVIPNGFDDVDFRENITLTPKFTITYTGYIYPGKRDPSSLFQALAEARQEGNISPQEFKIRFYGQNVNEYVIPLAQKYHVEDFVLAGGNIPFKESIKKQMESTALLLLSWNNPKDIGMINGKTYEYIGANRPILAMAYPGGEIDKLLTQSGCGIVANEPQEIKRLILLWFHEFKNTGKVTSHFHPDICFVNSYSRKKQAQSLSCVFNQVTSG